MAYVLKRYDRTPSDWDQRISDCHGKTVFHELAWHRHVASIHASARFQYFEIVLQGRRIGYFCALVLWKGPLRVMGSPLPGTGTNYMGPVFLQEADHTEVLCAILRYCRRHFIAHLELASDYIPDANFVAAGLTRHPSVTHLCRLPATEEEGFASLKSSCRNRVRKAQSAGLLAEVTDDPAIIEHFYAQYVEVYGDQGMAMPFRIDRPRSLFVELLPAGRLLPVWVRHGEEIAASGLFPFDENCIYFWGAVSWKKHRDHCPNELLHWKVIQEAIRRGIPVYNMCGGKSQFKNKFGGEDVPYAHYSKSFLPLLGYARQYYRRMHFRMLKLKAKRATGGI